MRISTGETHEKRKEPTRHFVIFEKSPILLLLITTTSTPPSPVTQPDRGYEGPNENLCTGAAHACSRKGSRMQRGENHGNYPRSGCLTSGI